MNETNLDHLLRATGPLSGWGSPAYLHDRDNAAPFDDLLVQAASPASTAPSPRASERRPADDLAARSARPAEPNPRAAGSNKPADSRPPANASDTGGPRATRRDDNVEDAARSKSPDNAVAPETEPAVADAASEEIVQQEGDKTENAQAAELAAAIGAAAIAAAEVSKETGPTKVAGDPQQPQIGEESAENLDTKSSSQLQRRQEQTPVNSDTATEHSRPTAEANLALQPKPSAEATPTTTTTTNEPNNHEQLPSESAHSPRDVKNSGSENAAIDRAPASQDDQLPSEQHLASADSRSAQTTSIEAARSVASKRAERPARKSAQNSEDTAAAEPRSTPAGTTARTEPSPTNTLVAPVALPTTNSKDLAAETSQSATGGDNSTRPMAPQPARGETMMHSLARLHRGANAASRNQVNAQNDDTPQVDAARFVGRVAKAFHTAQERGGPLQLRLSPPELGAVRLELVVQDGALAAKLEAETQAARRVLLEHLPLLRDRLAEQNIRIERFDVDVRQEGGGQPPNPQHGRQNQPQPDSRHEQPPRQPVRSSETAAVTEVRRPLRADTQINMVV